MRTRRQLLGFWIDALTAPLDDPPASPPKVDRALLPEYVRPPGAVAEERFVSLCERCRKCADACPHHVILPLGPAYGAAEGTPAILPRGGACQLCDDLPCVHACPSGALRPIAVSEVAMGTARLDPERCWAVQGQPCDYCVKECPLGEEALRFVGRVPEVGEACVGCGQCVQICTATPPALRIEAEPSPPGPLSQPIHTPARERGRFVPS